MSHDLLSRFFFFNDTATTEIYTLSLHDALPISFLEVPVRVAPVPALMVRAGLVRVALVREVALRGPVRGDRARAPRRSEEHTSELQSPCNLVCRLLLEKKKVT